jgi:hypothetical protein
VPYLIGFKLFRDGLEIPMSFLLQFLNLQGLPNHANAAGQILVAGLSPGQYDCFQDLLPPSGPPIASATVAPGSVVPLAMTLPARYMRRP